MIDDDEKIGQIKRCAGGDAMTDLTPFDRLNQYIATNRLIRKAWCEGERTDAGYETACLLVALAPEVGDTHNESDCPASVMWPWLARLTPWIDDAGSTEQWPSVVRRYASVVRRLDPSDDAASRRALLGSLITIVTEVSSHASGRYAAACDRVLALLREGPPADDPRWEDAERAARAGAWAARAAAWAGAEAAVGAAAWAASAAAWAGRDRIIDGILTALEREAMR